MKYVIGWARVRPGTRNAFLAASRPLTQASREEEGIDIFEFHPSVRPVMQKYVIKGRFDNILG